MVTLPLPHGLGAQSAFASSHPLGTSFTAAANRPICNQSESETAPLPAGRGETSACNPLHGLAELTITVKRCVALRLGMPLSVTVTTMRFVVEACAGAGVQVNKPLEFTLAPAGGESSA